MTRGIFGSIEESNRLIMERVISNHGGLDRKAIVEEVRACDPGNFAEHMSLFLLKRRPVELFPVLGPVTFHGAAEREEP